MVLGCWGIAGRKGGWGVGGWETRTFNWSGPAGEPAGGALVPWSLIYAGFSFSLGLTLP